MSEKNLPSKKFDKQRKNKNQNYLNNKLSIVHQYTQFAPKQVDELALLGEELNPDLLLPMFLLFRT